jgi:hypothetical protein
VEWNLFMHEGQFRKVKPQSVLQFKW